VAVVERKSLADLVSSLINGKRSRKHPSALRYYGDPDKDHWPYTGAQRRAVQRPARNM